MNRRYNRVGALFQGQLQAIEVDSDEDLAQLVRYIHLNPVKARLSELLVQFPTQHPMSRFYQSTTSR